MANGDTVVVVHTIRNEAGVKEVRAVFVLSIVRGVRLGVLPKAEYRASPHT